MLKIAITLRVSNSDLQMLKVTRLSSGTFGRLFSSGTLRLGAADAVQVEDDTLKHLLGGQLSDIKAAGTFKQEFEITTPQGPAIRMYLYVRDLQIIKLHPYVN